MNNETQKGCEKCCEECRTMQGNNWGHWCHGKFHPAPVGGGDWKPECPKAGAPHYGCGICRPMKFLAPVGGEGETQKGWRERLKTHETLHNGNCYCEEDDRCAGRLEAFIEELLAAQETAFKERVQACVPEEIPTEVGTKVEGGTFEVRDWNACRQEVLTRIERLSQ